MSNRIAYVLTCTVAKLCIILYYFPGYTCSDNDVSDFKGKCNDDPPQGLPWYWSILQRISKINKIVLLGRPYLNEFAVTQALLPLLYR